MTCKGICVRYKAQKPVGTGRYASGQRRCQICEIFIKWEGLWCPCCGYRLRTKPRNLKYKAKLRARVEADSIEAQAATEIESEVPEITVKAKSKTVKATKRKKIEKINVLKVKKMDIVSKNKEYLSLKTDIMTTGTNYSIKLGGTDYAVRKNDDGSIVFLEITKTDPIKVIKNKEKTPCQYCEKLFVYPDKHEKNCKKNSSIEVQIAERLGLKIKQ